MLGNPTLLFVLALTALDMGRAYGWTYTSPTATGACATDIIFIERFGAVKYYDAAARTLTLIGTVPGVSTASEDGLLGVAVERPFKNWVYVRIWDMQGREAASMRGYGRMQYPMPGALAHDELYILEVKTNRGTNVRRFFRP
jgi:hypothetical protein